MRILVMGGTRFIGRHLIPILQAAGHAITLVNRGQTAPEVFADLPQIHVDRRTDALRSALQKTGDWDAVIDLSCYHPADVESLLQALLGRVGRYVFLSTISVYADLNRDDDRVPVPTLAESAPMADWTAADRLAPDAAGYGARKAECERIVGRWQAEGLETVVLRPSVVYGAHDYTDRMAYWLWRAMSDRPFLLPDGGERVFTRTYAPDLAQALRAAVEGPALLNRAWNVAESRSLTWKETLDLLGRTLGSEPMQRAVSVPSERLIAAGLQPSEAIPLWLPVDLRIDASALWGSGLFPETPAGQALAESVVAFRSEGRPPKVGITPEREAELLTSMAPT